MRTSMSRMPRKQQATSDRDAFYRHVLETLNKHGLPYLVGGGYAMNHYMGLHRRPKDMDLFICRKDYPRIAEFFADTGYRMELTYPHWLGKLYFQNVFIDFIFSSGNGISPVDEAWFAHAESANVLGVPVLISPVEEMIWSKAFVMERERYDGADITHLLHTRGRLLDWSRLVERFGQHWRVLLSHLILFGFVYPHQRDVVPSEVMNELLERLRQEELTPPSSHTICQGTLLSREQYLSDVRQRGLQDGRLIPFGNLTAAEMTLWTNSIPERGIRGTGQ